MPLNSINRIKIIEEGNKYEKKGTWLFFKRRRNVPNEVLFILCVYGNVMPFQVVCFNGPIAFPGEEKYL